MALVSFNSNSMCGFKASLEIDRSFFGFKQIFTTETKTIDGMPDVKWYIKVYANDPATNTAAFGIYAYIESKSEKEIEYRIYNRDGTFTNGTKEILIIQLTHAELFKHQYNYYFDGNGKYKLQIEGIFFYKDKSSFFPTICNPSDWGLRLQENSEEDFEIVVGGETLRVHKFIISAESPVFKKMFENGFKEARECKVTITDSDHKTVKAFIDYCYGRDVSAVINNDTDEINLMYFADIYDCQTLKPQMESYLSSKISKENISLFVSTADKANALQLRQSCVEFVRKIIYSNDALTAEEMESFDIKFTKDVFSFTANK